MIKVKFTLEQALKVQRGVEVWLYSFFNFGTRWEWVVSTTPWPLYPGTETRCPFHRTLYGPQGRFGRVRKISPSPVFDPQTVHPVAIPSTLTRLNKGDS